MWEFTGQDWNKAFSFPNQINGAYSEYASGFAVCGDGSVRVIAQYKLGEDSYGPIFQPVLYEWERGMQDPVVGMAGRCPA